MTIEGIVVGLIFGIAIGIVVEWYFTDSNKIEGLVDHYAQKIELESKKDSLILLEANTEFMTYEQFATFVQGMRQRLFESDFKGTIIPFYGDAWSYSIKKLNGDDVVVVDEQDADITHLWPSETPVIKSRGSEVTIEQDSDDSE